MKRLYFILSIILTLPSIGHSQLQMSGCYTSNRINFCIQNDSAFTMTYLQEADDSDCIDISQHFHQGRITFVEDTILCYDPIFRDTIKFLILDSLRIRALKIPINLDYRAVNKILGENKYRSSRETLDKEMIFYRHTMMIDQHYFFIKWENNHPDAMYDIMDKKWTKIPSDR